jgi:hypothetical protein
MLVRTGSTVVIQQSTMGMVSSKVVHMHTDRSQPLVTMQ